MGETRGSSGRRTTSACALRSRHWRARNDPNLTLTPPCSRELQVCGGAGHDDGQTEDVASLADGDLRGLDLSVTSDLLVRSGMARPDELQ